MGGRTLLPSWEVAAHPCTPPPSLQPHSPCPGLCPSSAWSPLSAAVASGTPMSPRTLGTSGALSACPASLQPSALSCPLPTPSCFSSLHPAGTRWGQSTLPAVGRWQEGCRLPSTGGTGSLVASLAGVGSRADVQAQGCQLCATRHVRCGPTRTITQLSSFEQVVFQALNKTANRSRSALSTPSQSKGGRLWGMRAARCKPTPIQAPRLTFMSEEFRFLALAWQWHQRQGKAAAPEAAAWCWQCHRVFPSTCFYIFFLLLDRLSPAHDNPILHGQRG